MDRSAKENDYYHEVSRYYDLDAVDFEQRYTENPVLQRIREAYRTVTDQYPFSNALEIGCGPGFDAIYFAKKYPSRTIYGIDVSPRMVELSHKNVQAEKLTNIHLAAGSVEDVTSQFPDVKYDLIYVFFGGLNTVYDLKKAANHIHSFCTEDATLVLTFVNRYYITEIPLWMMTGRFDKAFERIFNKWQGYSDQRKIPSKPYSRKDIINAFSDEFKITGHRGYSILYPAWYRSHLLKKLKGGAEWLWKIDNFIAKTPFRNTGEYSLYTMKVK
ncbi:MAG: class I SAM-dependent methyltransferase [Balneolales bacterium]